MNSSLNQVSFAVILAPITNIYCTCNDLLCLTTLPMAIGFILSEITKESSPIGVDFSRVIMTSVTKGNEYGPYGRLKPMAVFPGDGFFHCAVAKDEAAVSTSTVADNY